MGVASSIASRPSRCRSVHGPALIAAANAVAAGPEHEPSRCMRLANDANSLFIVAALSSPPAVRESRSAPAPSSSLARSHELACPAIVDTSSGADTAAERETVCRRRREQRPRINRPRATPAQCHHRHNNMLTINITINNTMSKIRMNTTRTGTSDCQFALFRRSDTRS